MKPVLLAMFVLLGVMWIRIDADSFTDGVYRNGEAGFEIELPSGFEETKVPMSTFAVADASLESSCVVLVQDVPESVDARELMKHAEKRGRGAGYERMSHDPARVGGIDGYRSESRMKVAGTRFRNTELHFVREGVAVSVQCLAPEEDFDRQYLSFARAMDSFRWLP